MRSLLALALVLALSCGGPTNGAKAPGSDVVAKNVATSEGVTVAAACTPTGPELCFNANDDNCNGLIDEGCGVGTGVLQFMIAWGDSPADVDVTVVDPTGTKVHKGNRGSPGALQLEKSCPDDDCHHQNVENVFFEGSEPPKGRYVAEVKLVDPHGAELPVKVHFSVRIGSRTYAMDLALSPGPGEKQTFAFEL
jgi:tRNA (guanosine-2'-O-)-methyltransferase